MAARPISRAARSRPSPGRAACWPLPSASPCSAPCMCRSFHRCSRRSRSSRPITSAAGRAFGARHCDLVFDQPHYLEQARDRILGVRHIARELGKAVQVFTSGAVVCLPTQREADEYFRYFAVEHRDDGAIDTMLNLYLSPANQRAMTRAEAEQLRARYGAGYGGLLAVGDPDTVAGELKKLADAGFDGFCFSLVAYNDELPYFIQEVLPRLERMGLRQQQR